MAERIAAVLVDPATGVPYTTIPTSGGGGGGTVTQGPQGSIASPWFVQPTADGATVGLPLPDGAATASAQASANASLATIAANTPAAGQALMAASSPVVIASNQSAVPVSGAVDIGQANAASVLNAAPTTQYGLVVRPVPAAATAPSGVELSDGSASYVAAKTGQLPTALGQAAKANSLSVALPTDQVGTPGSPSFAVLTVQGTSSMVPLQVLTTGSTATYVSTATTTNVSASSSILRSIHILRGNSTALVTAYNANAGTTNKVFEATADAQNNFVFGQNGLAMANGITLVTTAGAGIVSVLVAWDPAP